MLEIRNLTKTYGGGICALDGLNLNVTTGMFGLLGPNGAGKTTLMRTIAGLQLADRGSIHFNGTDILHDTVALRRRLGYLPQSFGAYPYIGCRALLRHMAVLKGLPDTTDTQLQVDRLLELTNLTAHAHRPASNFSGGMRQRFGIAQALLGDPELLILDEPTAGLDPEERLRLYNLLSQLSDDRIILLSTHIVDDAEQLCPQVAIISGGHIRAGGETDTLVREIGGCIWQGAGESNIGSGAILLNSAYRRGALIRRFYSLTCPGAGFETVRPSLEDRYFLELRSAEVQTC